MGPLALMAKAAGFSVFGSDLAEGAISRELVSAGISFVTGPSAQDGKFLAECIDKDGVDWFVYTSALPADHPELLLARERGLRISKRDELIAFLVDKLGLSMVAVAGTHGKTTTTSMIIWACLQLKIPISYLVGTTLPFAASGAYNPSSQFLVYEADEYDRNFLHFSPWLAVIVSVSYDHPDIYKTPEDYRLAFRKFEGQSENVIRLSDGVSSEEFELSGKVRREDAALAAKAVPLMAEEAGIEVSFDEIVAVLNRFPGSGRRFERICPGVYSDYGHHPEEIAATIELASEEASRLGLSGVVAVYEPHQNVRQTEVFDKYRSAFSGVSHLFWLPTYLTREDPSLKIISPEEFIASLDNSEVAEPVSELDNVFGLELKRWRGEGYLILLLTAGPADSWLRKVFADEAEEERRNKVDVEGVRQAGEKEQR